MSNISDLGMAAAMAAIREQIDQCELGETLCAYLVSLVEADWAEAEPAKVYEPGVPPAAEGEPFWVCDWPDCEERALPFKQCCERHEKQLVMEPQPIVEVALVAKPANTPPVATNGHAPAADLTEEDAAREWIQARTGAGKPMIGLEEFADFTGWGRSRCQQFISIVLDEIRNSKSLGKTILAVNERIHADDDELAEAAFPGNAENADGMPGYITRAGYSNLQEYNSGKAAEKAARVKGETFNQADWLRKYRAKKALA